MKRYVLGLRFSTDETQVTLLHKTRPAWQAGKCNGIGGHVEEGEDFNEAMIREAEEEIGAGDLNWERFAALQGCGWFMWCYRAESDTIPPTHDDVGEEVEVVPLDKILLGKIPVIPNIRWLIPMALNSQRPEWPYRVFGTS